MPVPICPRCEYDLSGLVAMWTAACPMQATCSECGLLFDCSNVLSPRLLGPPWSFEHGNAATLRRWLRTSFTALAPWRLTGSLRIDHPVRPLRLVVFLASWLFVVYAGSLAGRTVLAAFGPALFPWRARSSLLENLLENLCRDHQGQPAAWLLLFPFAGTLQVPSGPGMWTQFPVFVVFLLSFVPTLFMPAWMLILGTTLSEARVRRVHLFRGLVYSIPGAASFSLGLAFVIAGGMWWGVGGSLVAAIGRPLLALLVLGGFPLYHAVWWWLFIARYLRIRHAAATVVLMLIMSELVLLLGFLFVSSWMGPF